MGVRTKAKRAATGAAKGTASLAAFFGAAELVAVATGPSSTPAVALGQAVIVRTPEWLKNFAISHFGEDDKLALTVGVFVVLEIAAALVGVLSEHRRAWLAMGALALLGALTGLAAATGAGASAGGALPSAVGAFAGAGVFASLRMRAGRREVASSGARETVSPSKPAAPGPAPAPAPAPAQLSRRRLLGGAGSLVALSAAAYTAGRYGLAKVYNATASRAAVRLPRPVSVTPEVAGTGFDVSGLAPYITPNRSFYRVDTALVVPQLSTEGYTLAVHGMVDKAAVFSYEDLLAMPLIERTITMVCVSDPVGGPYLGNARWTGVPLAHLLSLVRPHPGADQLFMTASDGMTIGADLRAAMDGRAAMLALGMNGEPLPFEHGFPVRAVIPGFYGYASACKWLVDLEVTTYAAKKAYWVKRGYARAPKGLVKLESKIDTPSSFAQVRTGTVTVAGSAWHPGVGIAKVEVSVDGGPWHEASLAAVESLDTWRLWRWEWQASPGSHSITVRAVDNHGQVQTAAEAPVLPDGTSGRQSVVVTVT